MANPETVQRIKNVISQVIGTPVEEIADDANFIFDLGANSMQSTQLIGAFEEEFEIEMEEDKALEIQSVDAAADFIQGYL